MEELKIWSIDNVRNAKVTALDTAAQTESEGLLEDILTRNPDMLSEGLKLIGRQTRTTGGPLDLLGVEPDGRLNVFELKRGTLSRDAVAQVIDYSSDLEDMDAESLYRHIAEESGNLGVQPIGDFEEWYRANYPDDASLTPLRMVLVGLGVDQTTERMVNYLARSGIDISLLTFHCFEQDGKTLFARQVEVESSNTPVGPRHRVPRSQQFRESIHSVEVERLVDDVSDMFMRQTVSFSETHSKSKRNFCLDYSWYKPDDNSWSPSNAATLFIETYKGGIMIGFHAVAVALATTEEFDRLRAEGIEFEHTPKETLLQIGQVDNAFKVFLSSLEKWNVIKAQLTALVEKVCARYTDAKQKALSEDVE